MQVVFFWLLNLTFEIAGYFRTIFTKKFFKNSNKTAKITFVNYLYKRIKFEQKKHHSLHQNYNKSTTFFNQNYSKSIAFFLIKIITKLSHFFNQNYNKSITFFLIKIITKVLYFFK